MLFVSQLQLYHCPSYRCTLLQGWWSALLQDILEIRVFKVPTLKHTPTHTHRLKSVGKIIKSTNMSGWAKQVSSLLNSSCLGYVRMLKRLTSTFSTTNYLIGIQRKGCFVIPWCVVSVIPATVMYRKHKN